MIYFFLIICVYILVIKLGYSVYIINLCISIMRISHFVK